MSQKFGSGQLQTLGRMTHSCLKFWPRSHTVVHNYTLTTTQYVQTAVDMLRNGGQGGGQGATGQLAACQSNEYN